MDCLPALVEAATTLLLVFRRPEGVPLAAALVAVIWLSTMLLQVPRHIALSSGFNGEAHKGLILSNWLRTVAWSTPRALVL